MSNVKAQSPNKIQNPNVKDSLNLEFDIHEILFPPPAMGSLRFSPSHSWHPLL
jgi:hypothetical protein